MTPAALFDFDCNLHNKNDCLTRPRFFTFIWQARGYCRCCDAVEFLSLWSIFTVWACWCLIQVSTVSSWQRRCALFSKEKFLVKGNWVADTPKHQNTILESQFSDFGVSQNFQQSRPATPVNHVWQQHRYPTIWPSSNFPFSSKGLIRKHTETEERRACVQWICAMLQHVAGSGFFCCTSITSSSEVLLRS